VHAIVQSCKTQPVKRFKHLKVIWSVASAETLQVRKNMRFAVTAQLVWRHWAGQTFSRLDRLPPIGPRATPTNLRKLTRSIACVELLV